MASLAPSSLEITQDETAHSKLKEAQKIFQNDQEALKKCENQIKKEKERLENEQNTKEQEYHKLLNEAEKLTKDLEQYDSKLNNFSSSSDARKMYGDVTPGDTTHQDVTLAYHNYFKSVHRNMPKQCKDKDIYEVWEDCAQKMQETFDDARNKLIKEIVKKVQSVLTDDHLQCEATCDLQRAFEMYLKNHMQKEDIKIIIKKVVEEDDEEVNYTEDQEKLVFKILTALKPDDHLYFIANGKI